MMQQKTGKCNRLPCPEGRGLRSRLVNVDISIPFFEL